MDLCLFFFFPFIYQVTYQVKVLGVEADAGSNRRKQNGHEWMMAEAGLGVWRLAILGLLFVSMFKHLPK